MDCGHKEHEDHLICAICGDCREDLDSSDICMDCGGTDESEPLVMSPLFRVQKA
jgi:hypothetical protein